MDFAESKYLYLLGVVPLITIFLIWSASQRRAAISRLGAPPLIATLGSNTSYLKRRWKITLWFVAFIFLVLALARPVWGNQVTVKTQEGVQVMVALDVSSSMFAEDIKPNRLARAKLTIEELMENLGGNDIGLVIFSSAAFVQFPLTSDFYTARSFLDGAGPWSISTDGTSLDKAIMVALEGFYKDRNTSRVILLLTDGEGHEGDPLTAAKEAAKKEVVIHAIGFGSPEGEPIPIRDSNSNLTGYKKDADGEMVLSRLDEATLRKITDETGGYYFRASASGEEIDTIVDSIAALETGEKEEQFEMKGMERFEWFAGAALLFLTAEMLIGDRRRGKLGSFV